ncbi:MAG: carbohydrate kinase family protein [Patescibacteria group bacterium]
MAGFDVVALGDLNADLIVAGLDKPPAPGTEVLAETYRLTLGGSAGIFAAVLGSLGRGVGFIGLLGRDGMGEMVRARLESHGVDTGGIFLDPEIQTGLTVSLMRAGDRALVTVSGTIACLDGDRIPREYLCRGRHLHVSSYYLQTGLRPALASLLAQARDLGLTTSLDTGWDPAEAWDWPEVAALLPLVDVFLPNETEAAHLTGQEDPMAALGVLLEAGAGTAAIKRGALGAVAGRGGERAAAKARRIEAVDTTGAGDSFNAGFVHRFLAGADLVSCLEFANACGALAAARLGGADGAPREEEVLAAMKTLEHCG